MEQPSVTIIIVHYRGLEKLRRCLDSLFDTRYDNFRVVLVDNGSTDGSADFVKKMYGNRVDVIRSEANLGFVGGNNLALQRVRSKYAVLLNDDTVVDPDWLRYLVEVAESDPSVGACQPKLLSLTDPRYFEYNGCVGGMLDVYGVPFCRGRVFDSIEEDRGQYDTAADVFWAGGAAILVGSKALNETGLLDELFYAHMEEIDFCWRMRLLGYKVKSVPKSVVYHLGGSTPLTGIFYLKHRNNLVVLLKNFSASSLLRYFPARVILDVLSLLFFLKKDKTRSVPLVKAYFWLLRNLKAVFVSRSLVQIKRRVPDSEIIKAMARKSVAIQYYVLGRKRFSQLQGLPCEREDYIRSNV